MKKFKRITLVFTLVCLLLAFPLVCFAHSGKTDANGGHHDYKNKSGLGSYHYHHGMSAHLHPNGICPYSGADSAQLTTTSNSTPKPSVKVNNLSTVMNVGDTCRFDAVIENTEHTDIEVTSSNMDVITVNSDQTLSAKGIGTSTITIGNDSVSKSFLITVKEVYATNLELSVPEPKLQIGDCLKVEAEVTPENTTNKKVIFEASDENIATISEDGTITGQSEGNVVITATTSNHLSKTLEIAIFEVLPESVVCMDEINMIVSEEQEFKVDVLPENANRKDYTVECDDHNILHYEDHKIEAVREGSTVLHIKTWNGIEKDIPVKVDIIPVESVNIIDSTEYIYDNTIDLADELVLTAETFPSNATYQNVTWRSSNPDVVSVENNRFFVKGAGNAILTCSAHNDIMDSVEISVIDQKMMVLTAAGSMFGVITIAASAVMLKRKQKQKKAADIPKNKEAEEHLEDEK